MLDTARLDLREFVAADGAWVFAYQMDPLYLRYYTWTRRTHADAKQFVQRFVKQQSKRPRLNYQLVLVLKSTGEPIGNCGIRIDDVKQREANIGYELDSRYWGQGYATEAAREMVRFGFDVLKMHRIRAECVAENVGSARVLEKIGMHLEGRLEEKEYIKGRWHDRLLYAILERQWKVEAV